MKTKFNYLIVLFAALLIVACNQQTNKVEQTQSTENVDWEYQMAYQRGTEAVIWAMPAVSMISMRHAYLSLGGGLNTIYWFSEVPTALQEAVTSNNQTPYATILLNTKEGPMVVDIPPATAKTAIFGSAVDIWQEPVADIGPAGADKGEGGKYVFLPPDYQGKEIEGCFNIHSNTYQITLALRLIPLGETSFKEAGEYAKNINAYKLTEMQNPPQGEYIDAANKHLPTLAEYDFSYFSSIKELIDTEPLLKRDMVMGGMLASIGIKKDEPFAPNPKIKTALEAAVKSAYDYMEYMFETPGFGLIEQWDGKQWMNVNEPSNDGFVFDEGDYLLMDARADLFHWATLFPRYLGKASAYLISMKDSNGDFLKGDKEYKLTVPANVPARDFWSVIVYSKKTKAWIYNDENKVGISSYDKDKLTLNDDGSVDLYFSKTAPEGKEANWIPTNGEDFVLIFRFYGPEEGFFDKSFQLDDVQLQN